MTNFGFRISDFGLNEKAKIRNPQSTIRNEMGFTLLEVMVAVAILGFVLVSLLGLQKRSTQDVMLAERMTTATLLAKDRMVQALSGTLIPSEEEGEFEEEEFKGYTWKKVIAPTPIASIMEVRVAVLWKEGEREEKVELVSYE